MNNKKPFVKAESPYELIDIYKPTQKLLKDLLNNEYNKLDKIKQTEENIKNSCSKKKITYQQKYDLEWILLGIYVDPKRKEIVKKIENYKKLISILKYKNQKGSKDNIRLDIERAKSVPISDFIDFNRANKACCIFHQEKTPSMHYYKEKNKVFCFSCNRSEDTIGVVMKLYNLEFVEAVKLILK